MIKDAKIIMICGRRGSGKSTKAKELIKDSSQIVVYDPVREYDREKCEIAHNYKDLLIAIKKGWNTSFRIAFQPEKGSDHIDNVATICDILTKIQQPYFEYKRDKKITFLVEEMSLSVPNNQNPKLRSFLDTCNLGRHYGLEIIGVTQRLAEINTTFRGNAVECYYYGLADATDLDAAAKKIGREYAEKLKSVPVHCGLHYNNGQITAIKNHLL